MTTSFSDTGVSDIRHALADHAPDTSASERAGNHAAVAMILRERESDVEALFIQRSERLGDPWSGHMAFPGGRRQREDDSLMAAAIRETKEEVGLSLDGEQLIGRIDDLGEGRIAKFDLSVSCFVFEAPEAVELRFNHEVADAVWIPLTYLSRRENVESYFFDLDPLNRPFYSFRYDGYVVWGLTYRLVVSFFHLFGVRLPLEERGKEIE